MDKHAEREWYTLFDSFLWTHGFKPYATDHCFYSCIVNDYEYIILLLYVHNVIIASIYVSGADYAFREPYWQA